MTLVLQVLQEKGFEVATVAPQLPVYDAIRLMAEKDIGALVVMEDDEIVGLISERDYARNVVLMGRISPTTQVSDVMVTRVAYARPDQTVAECMAVMTDARVRHLPVLDDGRLVGIVSIGDLVKSTISEQKFIIEELVHFISRDR